MAGCCNNCETASPLPGRNVVILSRAGDLPVRMDARVGEQTEAALYADVKSQALLGEFVEVRRGLILAAVTAEIVDAEVIRQDENDVGFAPRFLRGPVRWQRRQQRQGGE